MIELDYYKGDNTPLYDWIEEEWDALKDGQYGDYPGGNLDYADFGFRNNHLRWISLTWRGKDNTGKDRKRVLRL